MSHDNIPAVGIVYHVCKKCGPECRGILCLGFHPVIKCGSTVTTLARRGAGKDYRKKYSDCFLREAVRLTSDDTDYNWYGEAGVNHPTRAFSPFEWNLRIREHLEILIMHTFQIPGEIRSNQAWPIYQKIDGFDASLVGHIGARNQSREDKARGGRIGGAMSVKNGRIFLMATTESRAKGGRIGGLIAGRTSKSYEERVRDGHKGGSRTAELHPDLAVRRGRLGSKEDRVRASHIGTCQRWHINRGKECICGKHNAAKAA